MTEKLNVRPAESSDVPAVLKLLPDLADFDLPERREPKHLWQGDAELFQAIFAGKHPNTFCEVALNEAGGVIALAMITMREELMSHAPSAHLETLLVAADARGTGLGRKMLAYAEQCAQHRGAKSLSLHVFANNHRARSLYNSAGYDSELIRAIKWFD
ncbi:MAG: GNAT family N-acetyltransferase [Pseudomonadota bacterium]